MGNTIEFLLFVICDLILASYYMLCWNKLHSYLNKGIFKISSKMLLTLILTTIVLNTSSYLFVQPFRLLIIFVLLIAINYFLVSKDIKQALLLVVISQMLLAFAEFSFVIICSVFFGNKIYELLYEPIPSILLNIYIFLISLIIINRKSMKKLFLLFYNSTKNKEDVIYSLIIIFTLVIATVESHMNLPLPLVLITNIIMAIIFISIIITSKTIELKYEKISHKYETSISSLKEYEVMIDKFRIDTHENKNEFLTIRNMLKDKNKKDDVVKYIDKLIDNKIKDNDKIMKKTAKIPEGGLRATIYSKLCLMDKLKIKYNLNISREVRTTDLIKLDEDLVLKICKILGVFLDNAVEAVKGLKKKELSIDVYTLDCKLCIDITNNFKGNLDLDKISNAKYTTKGDGHGYGLTLVNNLLEEEPNKLENEKSINRDTFTQTLKIKM